MAKRAVSVLELPVVSAVLCILAGGVCYRAIAHFSSPFFVAVAVAGAKA
jgi:hypothetical protein